MFDKITFGQGSVSRKTETVGPRYDPYSQETYTIIINGEIYTLRICALTGYTYTHNDEEIHVPVGEQGELNIEIAITTDTGMNIHSWTVRI